MNLTQLARILKVTPQELRDTLPQIGFDIGQKAIKVDNKTAQRIIKNWSYLLKKLKKEKEEAAKQDETEAKTEQEIKKINIPPFITVRDLAQTADLPVSDILAELMHNGIFASMNEKIDYETAAVIGTDLGLEITLSEEDEEEIDEKNKLEDILKNEETKKLKTRPPIIVVMGHVDHGKTSLLDAIRNTNVIEGEAGGITQHIGAYQIQKNKRTITFIDTPGHEAFTAMRSRGARVADIAILVVAADDGVKPQTIEAFRIIEATQIPYIIAINKIDKEGADINKAKQELSSKLNITPEDWGGKTVCVPISAKVGTGIEDLLDMVLLAADTESKNMQANVEAQAAGTVIESHVDKSAGPVATILIQNGTLRLGDQLCFNNQVYGKVRSLENYLGQEVNSATPSTPVKILGLKIAPEVGDILEVGDGIKIKKHKLKTKKQDSQLKHQENNDDDNDDLVKLNLILKTDVLGLAEAICESLEKINTADVKAKIIHRGLGNINEGDIKRAEDNNAQIIAFNVNTPSSVEEILRNSNVKVNSFNIIYDLIDYVRGEMEALLQPNKERVDLGRLKVLAVFRTENDSQIVGGKVLDAKIEADSLIEVIQNDVVAANGKLIKLQSGKQDVSEIEANQECGIKYEGKPIIQEGDILQFYKEVVTERKL